MNYTNLKAKWTFNRELVTYTLSRYSAGYVPFADCGRMIAFTNAKISNLTGTSMIIKQSKLARVVHIFT